MHLFSRRAPTAAAAIAVFFFSSSFIVCCVCFAVADALPAAPSHLRPLTEVRLGFYPPRVVSAGSEPCPPAPLPKMTRGTLASVRQHMAYKVSALQRSAVQEQHVRVRPGRSKRPCGACKEEGRRPLADLRDLRILAQGLSSLRDCRQKSAKIAAWPAAWTTSTTST